MGNQQEKLECRKSPNGKHKWEKQDVWFLGRVTWCKYCKEGWHGWLSAKEISTLNK